MARPTWKGVLKISLVRIPIKVFPATTSDSPLHFNQLHEPCQSRIEQKRWCPTCEEEVPYAEIVKGFEFEQGKYVVLTEAELDAVRPDSTRVIDLTHFADVKDLDPLYIDRSYYLAPDGAGQAYATIAAALQGKVGIGKLALYGREYLVAVRTLYKPAHNMRAKLQSPPSLVLHTLHHAGELRSADEIDELVAAVPTRPSDVKLARQVIAAYSGPLTLAHFTDDYQVELRRLIDGKIAGEEIVTPAPPPALRSGSLLEQLLTSVADLSGAKKKPAKGKRKSVA